MRALARFAVRHWAVALAAWAGAVVLAAVAAPTFSEVATYDDAAFLPPGSTSVRGQDLIEEGWPDDTFTRSTVLVVAREDRPLDPGDAAFVLDVIAWLRSEQGPSVFTGVVTHLEDDTLTDALASGDGHALIVMAGLAVPPFSPEAAAAVHAIRDHLAHAAVPDGLRVHVTGSAALAVDEDEAIEATFARTQALTVGLVLVLLLWVLRSPVAALVPLITVGSAYVVALAVVALLAQAGMNVSFMFQTFSIVIVFGAGTDYALLMMSRYREELRRWPGAELDLRTLLATMTVLGGVLASSAASTIVGFSAQSIAEFGLFRTMGPALAIAVSVTLVAGLTLSPALMRVAGRWLYWPHRPWTEGQDDPDPIPDSATVVGR